MKFLKLFILVLIFLKSSFVLASGTVIGNGGEPLLHFLESTRFAMVESLRQIAYDPSVQASLCKKQTQLSENKKAYCQTFMIAVTQEMMNLNTDSLTVPFVLRLEPLLVEGPDGQPMPVAARTISGPKGPIEFHLDSIKLMAPQTLLLLMAHEFQHKILFENHFILDNQSIGPFQRGRELIDAVAEDISELAKDKGLIGTEFSLRDSFFCKIISGESSFNARFSTERRFFDKSLTNYESSLSKVPRDPMISVPETLSSDIVFQLVVSDKNHCDNYAKDKTLRKTEINLWRVFDNANKPAERVFQDIKKGLNPFCENAPIELLAVFNGVSFICKYFGSEGQSRAKK